MLSKNQIKEIQSLQLKKIREAKKLFIAEGIKTVAEIVLQTPVLVESIFATEEILAAQKDIFSSFTTKITVVNEIELKKISLQSTPSGILAVCHYINAPDTGFNFEKDSAFYLDDIRDPGNMGTIIRLADWFGIKTIFCSPDSCDLYNPKVIQSTMGAFLRVAIVYVALEKLVNTNNIKNIYGAVLNGHNLYQEKLEHGLIIIGNEANGIAPHNLEHVNRKITIPANQNNGTESLNAAMAASIIASEFFRQLKLT